DTVHHQLVQGVAHAHQGFVPAGAVGDQLADQRIVVRWYLVATVQVRIHPHTIATGRMEEGHGARARQEAVRVLGVDPALDGVATDDHVFLLDAQRLASADANLFLDDVDAGDHFRNRMLHLDTGVHLDEEELAVFIEELEGAGAAVTQIDTGLYATGLDLGAGLLVDTGGRCFLDDLLVPALQGAVTVAQVDGVALAVGQYLHFHVPRVGQELFQVDHGVAEGRARFGAGQADRLDQVFFLVHHAHAATTAATGGLDDHRIADPTADLQALFLVLGQRAVGAGHGRYTGLLHGGNRRHLVTHQADYLGAGADEGEAGVLDLLGEVGVFREEAIAGVDAVGTGYLGSADDARNVQVRLGGDRRADADGF